jgi:hypothetical protein
VGDRQQVGGKAAGSFLSTDTSLTLFLSVVGHSTDASPSLLRLGV